MSDAATIEDAVWRGDTDALYELAPCICCCEEHTFEGCSARFWFGCRGQLTMTRAEHESWAEHYKTSHGMSREVFFS